MSKPSQLIPPSLYLKDGQIYFKHTNMKCYTVLEVLPNGYLCSNHTTPQGVTYSPAYVDKSSVDAGGK